MFLNVKRLFWMVLILQIGLFFLLTPFDTTAQDEVPRKKIKEEFFTRLDRPQIITLVETLDRSQQLTDFELGAKYRWGHIPPDRRPPVRLARWWKDLSPREKSEQRVKWYWKHYQQINLDRAARELKLQDELTKIYRRVKNKMREGPGALEAVPFPGESVVPKEGSGSDTDYRGTFQQAPVPESNTVEGSDRSTPSGTKPSTNQRPSRTSEAESMENSSSDTTVKRTSSEKSENDRDVKPTNSDSDASSGDTITRHFGEGSIIYRRVGDHIEIIRGDTVTETDSTQSVSDRNNQSDELETNTEPSERRSPPGPSLNRRNEDRKSGNITIPNPQIRNSSSDEPRIRR